MEFDPSSTFRISVAPPNSNTNSVREELEMPISPNTDPIPQLASVSDSGPPECTPNQVECTEVITEQPPQYHDLFPPLGTSEEESAESVAIVEQALSTSHFNEANGFTLKYSGLTCCPSLVIIPTLNQFPLALGAAGWKMNGSSNDKCHCCCCFPPISIGGQKKWQTMTLKQNEQEILNFLYSPMVCCCRGRKDNLVHIYIPQRNQRIAVLRQRNSFSDEALLIDCVSKSVFILKKLDVGGDFARFAMTVLTQQGTEIIAIASPTRGWRRRGFTTWTDFELKFNTNVSSNLLSASSKSAIMVGFAMWAINYREENSRKKLFWILVAIFVGILFSVIKILYDSNSNSY